MKITHTFYTVEVNGQKVAQTDFHEEVQKLVVDAIRANGLTNVSWKMVFQNRWSNGFVYEETSIEGVMPTQEQVDSFGG